MAIDVQLDGTGASNIELLHEHGEQCPYCGEWFLRQQARGAHEAQCPENPDGDTSATVVRSEQWDDEPPYYVVQPCRGTRAYHTSPACYLVPDACELRERGAAYVERRGLEPCMNCLGTD